MARGCVVLCIFLIIKVESTIGVLEADLYPFGLQNGDDNLPANDDGSSPEISISTLFPFFNHQHRSLWVNNNGILSLTRGVSTFTPSPFPKRGSRWIVPFWGDVHTGNGGSLFYRESVNQTLLDQVTKELQDTGATTGLERFQALWMFIATWKDVAFFGANSLGRKKRNTFQAIVVTNGRHTFAVFNYARIEWTTGTASGGNSFTGLGGLPAQVGFNDGDGNNYFAVNGSLTPAIINLPNMTNCNTPGKFVFRIDGAEIKGSGCNSKGFLTVVPRLGSMLGGEEVTVSGPCFKKKEANSQNQIVAKVTFQKGIHKEQVQCRYFNDYAARCITPTLFATGHVDVLLTRVDELENNDIFRGHYSYENIARYSPKLVRDQPDLWTFKYKATNHHNELTLRWNAQEVRDILGCDLGRLDLFAITEDGTHPQLLPLDEKFSYIQININAGSHTLKESDANLGNYTAGIIRMACSEEYVIKNVKAVWSDVHSFIWTVPVSLENVTSVCDAWLRAEVKKDSYADNLGHCPCTADLARLDVGRFHPDPLCNSESNRPANCYYHQGAAHCVKSNAAPEERQNGGEHCCYDINGDLLEMDIDVNSGKRKAGRTSRYHYLGKDPFDAPGTYPFISNFLRDEIPYQYCCEFTIQQGVKDVRCIEYLKLRPAKTNCLLYEPPPAARASGEPHLVTLDGARYTFNGLGEYTMIESLNRSFLMQVRTEQAKDTNGVLQPASVFTAIAIKGNNTDLVQVNLNDITVSEILINGQTQNFDFHSYQEFNGMSIRSTNGTKVLVVFTTLFVGVQLDIGSDLMNVMFTGAQTMKNNTRGLLGVWNGDVSDDFMYPNGTTLHHDATGKQIHAFGESWRVEANDSLFTYIPGKGYDFYNSQSRRDFEPTFANELISSANVTDKQRSICGNSSECLFDLLTTNNILIAKSTKQAEDSFDGVMETIEQVSEIVRCPSLPFTTIPNGEVQVDGHKPGDNVTFTCHPGYELVGHNRSTCNSTGSWDQITTPTCKARSCGPPLVTTNSSVSNTSQEFQGVATYSCDDGYEQSGGNVTRICGTDLKWTGYPLECSRKNCGTPLANANSTVKSTSQEYEGVATYSCDDGYEQSEGNVTRICDNDAQWTGNPLECSRKSCGPPAANADSFVSSTSQEYEGVATYSCDAGYKHASGDVTRTCSTEGKWTGNPLECSRISCGPPPANVNSYVSSTSHEYEGVATYSCDDGFEQSGGNVSRTCSAGGFWTGTMLQCLIKDCGKPEIDVNTSVVISATTYKGTSSYSCDAGYQQRGGNVTRTCTAEGVWSGTALECTRSTSHISIIMRLALVYKANYDNLSDPATQLFLSDLYAALNPLYRKAIDHFNNIKIKQFRKGSVVVDQQLQLLGNLTVPEKLKATSQAVDAINVANRSLVVGTQLVLVTYVGNSFTSGINCSKPQGEDVNAARTGSAFTYGYVLTYTCKPGYKQKSGEPMLTCLSNATWNGSPLQCYKQQPTKSDFASLMGGISAVLVIFIVLIVILGIYLCRKRKATPKGSSESVPSETGISGSMVRSNPKSNLPTENDFPKNSYYQRYILPMTIPRDPVKPQHVHAPKHKNALQPRLPTSAQNRLWRFGDFPSGYVTQRP